MIIIPASTALSFQRTLRNNKSPSTYLSNCGF